MKLRHRSPFAFGVEEEPLLVDFDRSGGSRLGLLVPGAYDPAAGATSKLNIIPLSVCSAMWQWAIQSPGFVTSRRMSTASPARSSTVSFQTRLASGTPSRA